MKIVRKTMDGESITHNFQNSVGLLKTNEIRAINFLEVEKFNVCFSPLLVNNANQVKVVFRMEDFNFQMKIRDRVSFKYKGFDVGRIQGNF